MMNQKEAVYTAVINVMGVVENGPYTPTKDQRAAVNVILFEGFRAGAIQLDREFTDTELKAYVSGLQSNWLRKDPRLNGGVKYQPKNPGSRTGQGDAQLRAMKVLLDTVTDPADKAEIQSAIDARIEQLKPAAKSIDLSILPEALKKFVK